MSRRHDVRPACPMSAHRDPVKQKVLPQCGSTNNCLSRSVPEMLSVCCWNVDNPREQTKQRWMGGINEDISPQHGKLARTSSVGVHLPMCAVRMRYMSVCRTLSHPTIKMAQTERRDTADTKQIFMVWGYSMVWHTYTATSIPYTSCQLLGKTFVSFPVSATRNQMPLHRRGISVKNTFAVYSRPKLI